MKAETKQKVQKLDGLLKSFLDLLPYPTRENQLVHWPSHRELSDLRHAIRDLAMTQRKKETFKTAWTWKAYELVNKRWPKLRLVKRINELVERARHWLKEANATELSRIRIDASTGAPKAKRLLEDLEAIQEDANNAAEIDWQDYKELLFQQGSYRFAIPKAALLRQHPIA
jgi:hypothetical protein